MIAGTVWQHMWGYVFEPDKHGSFDSQVLADLIVYKVANVLYQRKKWTFTLPLTEFQLRANNPFM
jgi:hypothetical protein